ncbi:MAG: hypothetical protein IIZ74_06285 [Erysipelotrichaceae bacterium]|nr:hypothetical protein [Erysipelotrichaceae bacterium]
MKSETERIEELLDSPYCVIDFLPYQVPARSAGQFFAVEELYMSKSHYPELLHKFADIMLKLNCFYDFKVYRNDSSRGYLNPKPESLEKWLMENPTILNILINEENTLLSFTSDSTCMTLYNPSATVLKYVQTLAAANGLFVWFPRQYDI